MQSTNLSVAIIALTCGRPIETGTTYLHNLAGSHQYPLYVWSNQATKEVCDIVNLYNPIVHVHCSDNMGIAAPLNRLAQMAFDDGADVVVTMANDILEPDGWIEKRIEAIEAIPNIAVVAIPPTGTLVRYTKQVTDGITFENGQVIGNWAITRDAFEQVGKLYEGFGIYGPIDLEYCDRCDQMGYKTIYLSNEVAKHIGNDDPPEYKKAKMDSLAASWELYKLNKR